MILYRYIIKEHIFPFFSSLSIIVFLFVMQQAVYLLDKIISKGLDPIIVLEVFIIQLGWIIALAIPMAILTSTLMTFGRMSGDNEITSIKASGQSLIPLMVPVFSAAAVLGVLLIFFNNSILPDANHRTANLISDISRKKPAAFIEPGILIRDFTGYTIYTSDVDSKSGLLRGIKIFSDMPNQDPSITMADSGLIRMTPDQQYLEMTLFNGESHSTPRNNKDDYFIVRFKKQIVSIKNVNSDFERTSSSYRSDREKSSSMMLSDIKEFKTSNLQYNKEFGGFLDSIESSIRKFDTVAKSQQDSVKALPDTLTFGKWVTSIEPSRPALTGALQEHNDFFDRIFRRIHSNNILISQYMVEVHKKYSIPAACLIFVLIGAPLGIMARRGGVAVGASYSLFFFILNWIFLLTGESMADKMKISPFLAMWSGNILIGICGIILTLLMLQEKTIQFGWVINIWKRLTGGEKKRLKNGSNNIILKIPAILFWTPRWFMRKCIGTSPTYLIGLFLSYVIGISLSIIVIFVVINYIDNLRRFEGVPIYYIALDYLYFLPWIVQVTMPIVLLLASMFSIGRMAKNSELTALKASGMSVSQLTMPLLLLGILFSVGTFYGGEKILPTANLLKRELEDNLKDPTKIVKFKAEGIKEYRRDFYYFGNNKTLYRYDEFSTSPYFVRGAVRQRFENSRIIERIKAESVIYDDSTGWRFINAEIRDFRKDPPVLSHRDSFKDTILSSTPSEMVARIKKTEEMSYWELNRFIGSAKRRGENVNKFLGELDFKIALPFMNFIVILLGVSITARAGRKGGAMVFGIGLALVFSYWIISRFSIVFAQNGHLPVLLGAWLGNILFLMIGLVLFRKASQ
jgi:lipopolysaccharide export system permease protein